MNTTVKILEKSVFAQDSVISALSGVACVGDEVYFVGDNLPYLLRINRAQNMADATVFEKIPLFDPSEQIPLSGLSKKQKPDFEALTSISWDGQSQLLVMGSGSTDNRKRALLYNPANYQVRTFLDVVDYDFLQHQIELTGGADLNIEAICSDHRYLYIFQRGNINLHHGVLIFDLIQIQAGKSLANALVHSLKLSLAELDGSASGISDACFLADKNLIVATAAVEQTLNTYDDGAVLGSFILVFSPDGKALAAHLIQDAKGQPLPIKVEGITWFESRSDGEVFLLVTDSDGGDSEILKVLLSNAALGKS